jgi:dTDP-4-amino-4,6-dideoxygalactose transaminase
LTTPIGKTASNPATSFRPSLFYGSAREGMYDFLLNNFSGPSHRVLLPAFIGWSPREGSGVLDPVLQAGTRPGFYDLNADLTVDLDSLERELESSAASVLVVIHYFGRTEPQLAAIRALADKHAVVLVEDLAHGFFSALGAGDSGRHGQVRLFSLHKMFPFPDGGMATYSSSEYLVAQKSTRPELANQVLSYDWRSIGDLRRRNFAEIAARLQALRSHGVDFELLWPTLAPGDVPQTLPVRVLGEGRDAIYESMNREGFGMVSLYHTLIDAVGAGFVRMHDLSHHIINFPVHQDVSRDAIPALVESFAIHVAHRET